MQLNGRLIRWLSGITSFTSGEVVGLSESYDDNSLSGAYNASVDAPSYANNGSTIFQAGVTSKSPRNQAGLPYFNPNYFTTEPLGQIGNAMRRSFHGPGVNNTDLALLKNTRLYESVQLQFRAEAFNAFNHTQFDGADGEIGDGPGQFGFNWASFAVPPGREVYWLEFPGINYRAEIWVNGKKLADNQQVAGMYVAHDFNVSQWVKPGSDNVVAVRVTPERLIPDVNGVELGDSWHDWLDWKYLGSKAPRSAHYREGWTADRNAGVFKPVYLHATAP